ncbi:MAG TPA: orotidine-5'-phosphate decarboxylase [Candidatus Cloacimonetes bacterium]|nr:orotidine-5'-phosphate decarboxylase [Candidatus Cloacimonadota bacterium]HEX37952.1 orotidine-5'-phosphate decarboxylase [Candidatus Cloacimonadota bacterium]
MNFKEKYYSIVDKNNSLVCVGLDTDIAKIPAFLTNEKDNPQWEFNRRIIDATKDYVAAYKPNFAFYISQGRKGLETLERTIAYIPDEIPIILDAKVGDIGNTMKHYANAYFDHLEVDAITINPLMGYDVLKPFESFKDKYLFLLALTSNPSNRDFLNSGNRLYTEICYKIKEWNMDNLGVVVGATNDEEMSTIRELLPDAIFLIPGIGAQGGSLENVMKFAAGKEHPNILVNSSRGIIFSYEKEDERCFEITAMKACKILIKSINDLL